MRHWCLRVYLCARKILRKSRALHSPNVFRSVVSPGRGISERGDSIAKIETTGQGF